VQLCLEKGCELQDLSVQELRQLNPLFDEDFYSCLDLPSVLALHDVPGGTAPGQVQRAIADAKHRVELIREESHAHA
jgi:argininosuccinate lyase